MACNFCVVCKLTVLIFTCLGAYSSPAGKNLSVQVGRAVEISCIVFYGSDSPTFIKDGVVVQSSDRHTYSPGKVTINPVEMSDAGTYSCKSGDNEEVVGRLTVNPRAVSGLQAVGITAAVIGGSLAIAGLIIGIAVYKQRCRS